MVISWEKKKALQYSSRLCRVKWVQVPLGLRAREIAQNLRALVALADNPCWVLSTHRSVHSHQ